MGGNYTVYILEVPDGKRYIGCTKQSLSNRWQNGNGYKGNKPFYDEIQKNGWENIKKKVVLEHATEAEASALERELIMQFHSNNSLYGFNHSLGGEIRKKEGIAIIPDKIKLLRKKKGLTQQELATLTRVSQGAIQGYETGRIVPHLNTLIQLAKVLNVSADDLIDDERSVDSE